MLALLAAAAAALAVAAPAPLPRSIVDRPDDVSGPQVHLVYAIPADGVDHALDTNGTIAGTVSAWEGWLAGQTGGRVLRLDTYRGADDITFVQLPQTDAEIASRGAYVRDLIEGDLKADGLIVAGKIYAVYYDGSSTYSCGGGAWPPVLSGVVAALYLQGAPPGAPPCNTNRFATPGEQPGYLDFAMLHELLHTLGFVPSCAPHFTQAGHVSDSNADVLYAGPLPWYPSKLDVGHDDYFDAHIPGCPDLADSPFLTELARASVRISVAVVPGGTGTVSGLGGGPCRTDCATHIAAGTTLTLMARPARGWRFAGWRGGGCPGPAACRLDVTRDLSVQARFVRLHRHA